MRENEKWNRGYRANRTSLKRIAAWILALAVVLSGVQIPASTVQAADITATQPSGSGTANDPYLISSESELVWFRTQVNSGSTSICAKLTSDITSTESSWARIGNDTYQYAGTFDGNGHTISGLTFSTTLKDNKEGAYRALFGYLGTGGIAKNVTVKNATFTKAYNAAAIAVYNYGTISNCHSESCIFSNIDQYAAGICAENYGKITGCSAENNSVHGDSIASGICAVNTGEVTESYVTCTDTSKTIRSDSAGGIVGQNDTGGTILDCYNSQTVTGSVSGGIVGQLNAGKVSACYNIGTAGTGAVIGNLVGNDISVVCNTHALTGTNTVLIGGSYNASEVTSSNAAFHSLNEFASGTVAWLLNGSNNDNSLAAWKQNLDNGSEIDAYPVLDSTHGFVYQLTDTTYSNSLTDKCAGGHTLTAYSAKAATCYQAGNTAYWKCSVCGKYFSDEKGTTTTTSDAVVIAKTAHTYGTPSFTWTKTTDGYSATATYTCTTSGCGATVEGHTQTVDCTVEKTASAAATCTQGGSVNYQATATLNGVSTTDTKEVSVAATGHTWGSTYVDNGDGTHSLKCTVCGALNSTRENHTGGTATCYSQKTCSACGASYGDRLSHSYPEQPTFTWTENASGGYDVQAVLACKNSCCTNQITQTCTVENTTSKSATCTTNGDRLYTATAKMTVNGTEKTYTDTKTAEGVILATGHTLTHVDAVAAGTCVGDGCKEYWKCSVCGKYFADADGNNETTLEDLKIVAPGHDNTNIVDKGDGTHTGTCSRCGTEFTSEPHTGGTATCTKKAKCEVCGAEYGDVDTGNHSYGDPTYEWTAADDGYQVNMVFTCTRSGCDSNTTGHTKTISSETSDITKTVTKQASCTNAGSVTYQFTKTVDGITYQSDKTVDVPATGHTLKKVAAKAATCTEGGNKEYYKCSDCGSLFEDVDATQAVTESDVVISALGHSYDYSAKPTFIWTKTADGNGYTVTATFACTRCSESVSGHTKTVSCTVGEPVVVEATTTQTGSRTYTATVTVNEKTYKDTHIDEIAKISSGESDKGSGSGDTTNPNTTGGNGDSSNTDAKTGGNDSATTQTNVTNGQNSAATEQTATKPAAAGTTMTDSASGAAYTVVASSDGTPAVSYRPASQKTTKAVIPAVITLNGVTYRVTAIDKNAFAGNQSLQSVTIGANVETISDGAFRNCKKLKKVTIPKSVTSIGKQAFAGCKKLRKITILTTKLTKKTVGAKVLKGVSKKTVIEVPKSVRKEYKKIFKAKGVKAKVK